MHDVHNQFQNLQSLQQMSSAPMTLLERIAALENMFGDHVKRIQELEQRLAKVGV